MSRLISRFLVGSAICITALHISESPAQTLPPNFTEEIVFSGLVEPTAVAFASDGRVFVAEKSGLIKVFASISSPTPTVFADLRTNVHNFWDRGLLGLTLHPNFPTTPYVYVLYTYDAPIGGTAPRWGTVNATSDGCPNPPGATGDGCVVSGRLSRLQAAGSVVTGTERVLIEDWCQQYPSHSVGALAFGPDGALYVSAGDGASFNFVDYGQDGSPRNPCGDPPVAVGGVQAPPTAEGGALRSQSVRRPANEPRVLGGSILRVDPETGNALPENPMAASPDANARRIIAYGLRNPFRISFRPGTSELWSGDVGWNETEEINRIVNPTGPVSNFGWPCYEGSARQSGYDSAGLNICENLYLQPGAETPPAFAYRHADRVVPGETCGTGSSSISGLAFYSGTSYPAAYAGALFFADYSRNCIWVMFNPPGAGGGGGTPSLSYGFNEGSGTTSADLSGNNHPATLVNGATWTTTAISGNAVQLSGTRYVQVSNPGMPTGDFTASVWVNLTSTAAWQNVMEMLTPASTGWELDLEPGGQLTLWTNSSLRFTTTATVPVNTWTYLTLRRQGSTWQLFINGVPQPQTATDGTVFAFGTCPFYIGVDADIGCTGALNGYLQGRVDEVRVYSRPLTQSEIQADMATPVVPTNPSGGPSSVQTLVAGAAGPVDLKTGPNGDLFYVDFNTGTVRRIRHVGTGNRPPTAVAQATPTNGLAPLTVTFDGRGSSDPDPGDTISYAWDLDGDGQFDDSTAAQPVNTYFTVGNYAVRLRVTDNHGASSTSAPIVITVGTSNTPPTATIVQPLTTSTWKVGDIINFSGQATDNQDGTLPAAALSWAVILHHCPSNCHEHHITDFVGVASGAFTAPDHEYPSHLELRLTATDSQGATDVKSVSIQPQTVPLTFESNPSGLQLTVGSSSSVTPFNRTVIIGSVNSVSAPSPQILGGSSYQFVSWSDTGAQTHDIVAATVATTYTAAYESTSPPPTGLVLAYGFNEGSGTTSADLSGNNHPATLVNGATWTTTAISGNAVQLSGTRYVQVSNPGMPTGDFTASVWVNLTSTAAWQNVMEMLTPASTGWELDLEPGGQLTLWTNNILRFTTTATVPVNTWTYLTLRRQGSTWQLFINGVPQPQTATDGTVFAFGTCPFYIGVDADVGCTGALNGYLQGRVDEVRVYSRALTQAEIQADMAAHF